MSFFHLVSGSLRGWWNITIYQTAGTLGQEIATFQRAPLHPSWLIFLSNWSVSRDKVMQIGEWRHMFFCILGCGAVSNTKRVWANIYQRNYWAFIHSLWFHVSFVMVFICSLFFLLFRFFHGWDLNKNISGLSHGPLPSQPVLQRTGRRGVVSWEGRAWKAEAMREVNCWPRALWGTVTMEVLRPSTIKKLQCSIMACKLHVSVYSMYRSM